MLSYVGGLHRGAHHSWKDLTLYFDVCRWKERGVTRDETLAAKLYAKPTGCISQRSGCIAAPMCITASWSVRESLRSGENQSILWACAPAV